MFRGVFRQSIETLGGIFVKNTRWCQGGARATLSGSAALVLFAIAGPLAPLPALAQSTPLEQQCAASVQDQVPYDQGGDKHWNPKNINRLCSGTTNPQATISCFTSQIQNGIPWTKAIPACANSAFASAGGASNGFGPGRDAEAAAGINGQTANFVVFGQSGQKLGDYRELAPSQWAETDANGNAHFYFRETNRDQWSIYLSDPSRRVKIQLDLFTRQVKYSDAHSPQRPLYDVFAATVNHPPVDPQASAAPAPQASGGPSAYVQPPSAPVPAQAPAPAAAAGTVDSSHVVLRVGAVNDANDAGAKCAAICQPYQGYSGRFAITNAPNLAVCQCNATPLAGMKANEIAVPGTIQSDSAAGQLCPTACQYYGGGDGTWRTVNGGVSVCGCAQAVQQ